MGVHQTTWFRTASVFLGLLCAGLAVALCVSHRTSLERARRLAAAEQSERAALKAARTQAAHNQILRHMLGLEPLSEGELLALEQQNPLDETMAEAVRAFRKDVEEFGSNLRPVQQNYRSMLRSAGDVIHSRNEQLRRAEQRDLQLIAERDQLRHDLEDKIARLEQAHQAALADLHNRDLQNSEELNRLQSQNQELARQLVTRQQAMADLMTQYQVEMGELRNRSHMLELRLEDAMDKIARLKRPVAPDQPDGEITWVGGRTRTAQIDLGAADGLKRQVVFLVYAKGDSRLDKAMAKGKVEVTTVRDSHRAEVRIVEEKLDDPIMPGDRIYSPAWQKGHRVQFAIAGKLDIDGDGDDDAETVKSLIAAGGGVVDAELKRDGSMTGKMSLETDFLVQGSPPVAAGDPALLQNYTRMIDQAGQLGVAVLPLDRFLDLVGYAP